MKKLASSVDMEDLALELGASLTRADGLVFNASGRSGATRLPERPKVAPEPAPVVREAPRLSEADTTLLLNAITSKLQLPEIKLPEIVVPPAHVVVNPQAPHTPCSWEFEFVRNNDGSLKTIKAKPTP